MIACVPSFGADASLRSQVPEPVQAPRPAPPGTRAQYDLAYVLGGHERQKLDLFVPDRPGRSYPILIWFHGGGWMQGGKGNCPPLNLGYTTRGYAVASVDYRLSSDSVFPAQIEDCKSAIRWLRAHASEYGLDPARVGVWGRSAGGHLVALLGTSGGVAKFDQGANLDYSSRVQAVCDFAGPTALLEDTTPGSHLYDIESKLIGGPLDDPHMRALAAAASPVTYVAADAPPFLIVQGGKDNTVPLHQSELLYVALKQTGVPVHFHTIRGGPHGIPGAGHGMLFSGPEIPALVQAFFDYRLLGRRTAAADWPVALASASDFKPDVKEP